MDVKTTERLLTLLKRYEPITVLAYTASDDEPRRIAVPQGRRRRWGNVVDAINLRPWSHVDFVNKKDEVLGGMENTSAASDLEDVSDGRTVKMRSEAEWAVALAMKTGRELLAFRSEEHRDLLKAQGEIIREMGSAMKGLAALYGEQRDAAADVAALRAEADNGGADIKGLLEAAPALLQMLPHLKEMLNGKGKH